MPIFGVNKDIRTPYVINWNFNLERALWSNATTTIAYVGNKGNKLYSIRDINQNVYANDVLGDEMSGRPFVNKFPYLSFIDMLGNQDSSIYHGLQVTVRQRTNHGVYFVAGYTYAHAIDTSSGNRALDIQDSYNPAVERGNSSFDIRHRFTFAVTYDLPSRKGYKQMLEGWRMNSIFTAQTGAPLLFYDSLTTSATPVNLPIAGTSLEIQRKFTGRRITACHSSPMTEPLAAQTQHAMPSLRKIN